MSLEQFPSYAGLSLLLLVLGAGCSEGVKTYPVRGSVRFPGGQPLERGFVEFEGKTPEGRLVNASSGVDADGSFRLSAVEGRHRVIVVPYTPPPGSSIGAPAKPQEIDTRFAQYETSGLEVAVTPDPDKNIFELHVERPRSHK